MLSLCKTQCCMTIVLVDRILSKTEVNGRSQGKTKLVGNQYRLSHDLQNNASLQYNWLHAFVCRGIRKPIGEVLFTELWNMVGTVELPHDALHIVTVSTVTHKGCFFPSITGLHPYCSLGFPCASITSCILSRMLETMNCSITANALV